MSASDTEDSEFARTHPSLLFRVRNTSDREAWDQFARLYGPLIHRFGCRNGLQDADAADLTQDVLLSAALALVHFEYDPQRGRFRSWLFTVARNCLNRMLRRRIRRVTAAGGSGFQRTLAGLRDDYDHPEQQWDRDYRQRLFEWALEQVRLHFQVPTWQAFSRTAIDNIDPAVVAAELGMSVGAVYVARSRVTGRLRNLIRQAENI